MKVIAMMDQVKTIKEEMKEGMEEGEEHHGHEHKDGHKDEDGHGHDEDHEKEHAEEAKYDEHVWTSPLNTVKIVEAIEQALSEVIEIGRASCRERV